MCNTNNKIKKEKRVRDNAAKIFKKRYEGIIDYNPFYYRFMKNDDEYENEEQKEYDRFSWNFSGNIPIKEEIWFTEYILNELKDIAKENNVELSTQINAYLLRMLERDRPTQLHTKARKAYIENNLYPVSSYIQRGESLEKFKKNILKENFFNYKDISYKNNDIDEEIYIINFLLSKGYTLNQIKQIEKEEKEIFGTFQTEEGRVMNPIHIEYDIDFKEPKSKKIILSQRIDHYIFIPTRLGFHYIIMNKSKNHNNYEEIEKFLNENLKGRKIWEFYKEYLKATP